MTRRLALWLALRTIEVVAILVPAAARSDWKREWHGELRYRSAQLQRRRNGDWRANMDLLGKALGAFPDAAWIRRQFTLDADAVHDAAHSARMLFKTPGFTAITVLVFAVGIGATTAIVSVADALFMRPLASRAAAASDDASGSTTARRAKAAWTWRRPTLSTGSSAPARSRRRRWSSRLHSTSTPPAASPAI